MMLSFIMSSALIISVLLIRLLLRDKVSARVTYALWLIVLLRLLIPVQIFEMPERLVQMIYNEQNPDVKMQKMVKQTYEQQNEVDEEKKETEGNIYAESAGYSETASKSGQPLIPVTQNGQEKQKVLKGKMVSEKQQIQKTVFLIWGCVALALFLVIVISNYFMLCRVKRSRIVLSKESRPYQYQTDCLGGSCLYGLFRPAIYLKKEVAQGEQRDMILLHERAHYHHLDHIWAAFRVLIVCVYWFHPMVWIAARVSKMDAEYAADEAVIRRMGEKERIRYGEAILDALRIGKREKNLYAASMAVMSKKELKKRMEKISGGGKKSAAAAIVLVILAFSLGGCSFVGKPAEEKVPEQSEAADTVSGSASGGKETIPKKKDWDSVISKSLEEELEVMSLLVSTNQYVTAKYKCYVEAHKVLGVEEKQGSITAYTYVCGAVYGTRKKQYQKLGEVVGYRIYDLQKKKESYEVTDVWQSDKEGQEYYKAVKSKFPENMIEEELEYKINDKLWQEVYQKAMRELWNKKKSGVKKKEIRERLENVTSVEVLSKDGHTWITEVKPVKELVDAYNHLEAGAAAVGDTSMDYDSMVMLNFMRKSGNVT